LEILCRCFYGINRSLHELRQLIHFLFGHWAAIDDFPCALECGIELACNGFGFRWVFDECIDLVDDAADVFDDLIDCTDSDSCEFCGALYGTDGAELDLGEGFISDRATLRGTKSTLCGKKASQKRIDIIYRIFNPPS